MSEINVPTLAQLRKFEVNRQGDQEVIRQSLYDFQDYPTAGASILTFYQTPAGQNSKTLEDTNMQSAGALPSPQRFLMESLEIYFYSDENPSQYGTGAASDFQNDVYNVLRAGFLRLFIGSKDYLIEGPLNRFPPKTKFDFDGSASDSTTAGADQAYREGYAVACGRPYRLAPPLLIPPTQNFRVSLEWPNGAVALDSGTAGRIGIVADGLLYRLSQ